MVATVQYSSFNFVRKVLYLGSKDGTLLKKKKKKKKKKGHLRTEKE